MSDFRFLLIMQINQYQSIDYYWFILIRLIEINDWFSLIDTAGLESNKLKLTRQEWQLSIIIISKQQFLSWTKNIFLPKQTFIRSLSHINLANTTRSHISWNTSALFPPPMLHFGPSDCAGQNSNATLEEGEGADWTSDRLAISSRDKSRPFV